MTAPALFTLGTRGSPLALAQANEARRMLAGAHGWEIERIALQIIRTTGDRIQDRPLARCRRQEACSPRKSTLRSSPAPWTAPAVYSAKDLPSIMPDGVAIAAYLPREDVRDALISALADTIEGLPHGATFGAASLRRQAQALRLRPDLESPRSCAAMSRRGSSRPSPGIVGATLLAIAGLKRLGLAHRVRTRCSTSTKFLPAPRPRRADREVTARAPDARALRSSERHLG